MKNVLSVNLVLMVLIALAPCFGSDECMDCHGDADLTMEINDSTEVSVYVNPEILEGSVHGGFACADCHQPGEDHPDGTLQPAVNCAGCHDDVQEIFAQSVHGMQTTKPGIPQAACKNCHGTHNILSSDDSTATTFKFNIGSTCGKCHEDPRVLNYLGIRGQGPVRNYQGSVHDQVLHTRTDVQAPTCIDCHDYHLVQRKTNPDCNYAKRNIPATCGKCHTEISEKFTQSIHWKSVLRGHVEPPVCNDCHGEHHIISHEELDAVTNRLNEASKICKNCHASQVMMKRFGLDTKRFETYSKSYHGLAVIRGSEEAATCTSCHEVHAIRARTDSLAGIHPKNLTKTCGKCHENVTADFTSIEVHPADQKARNPIAYYVRTVYIWLIVFVIGGMLVHNLLIIFYHIRQKKKAERAQVRYQRFRPFEVYQHFLMFLSFATLAITGFALKFPNAAWVQLLAGVGLSEYLRGLLHRGAALLMIAISLVQLIYFLFTKNGRKEILALIPTLSDLNHLFQNLSYHLGLRSDRPQFGRFDYGEKAEYLALIWGVIIMGASGFVLWFPEFFMQYLPAWGYETFEVIHYLEAWLATLAILVWHWFFVILHPDNYPLNLTLLDGKITENNQKHHHPLEEPKAQTIPDSAKTDKIGSIY